MNAVLLLSGGLDSYTAGAMARADGYELYAMTIRYGQLHPQRWRQRVTLRRLSESCAISSSTSTSCIGGSALLGDGAIPKGIDRSTRGDPVDLRPRTQHDLPLAGPGVRRGLGADAIVIGVNALDYSGYPDCRPDYFRRSNGSRGSPPERAWKAGRARPRAAGSTLEGQHHSTWRLRSASTTA